jgi:hypothetical protein
MHREGVAHVQGGGYTCTRRGLHMHKEGVTHAQGGGYTCTGRGLHMHREGVTHAQGGGYTCTGIHQMAKQGTKAKYSQPTRTLDHELVHSTQLGSYSGACLLQCCLVSVCTCIYITGQNFIFFPDPLLKQNTHTLHSSIVLPELL